MGIVKAYTSLEQSRILTDILPTESADMCWIKIDDDESFNGSCEVIPRNSSLVAIDNKPLFCWSLAALLNILHSRQNDIASLSGGGYKDGKYISDWCLDYEYDNGNYQKTFADNPIDVCYKMIIKLHEENIL